MPRVFNFCNQLVDPSVMYASLPRPIENIEQQWFAAFALVAVASLYAFARWDINRNLSLLAFCKEAKAGLSIDDFFALEKRFGIDDTFVVGSGMSGYAGHRSTKDLEFRSQPIDPYFACAVDHDGRVITNVQLLTLEGFDPGQ
jgi:hypothetical protein